MPVRSSVASSLLAFALVCLLVGPIAAQSSDAPPGAPGDPVANVYSATAGAVRWGRATDDRGAVPGYEVTRDGIVLGVFDALSHVDFALEPDTVYEYGVTAIDSAGQRSTTSIVSLRTPPLGDFGPVTGPSRPAELRANLWSSTAAGLVWRRAAEFGTRYIVSRDGEVLRDDTTFPLGTFGPTYSDFDMTPGRDHVYEIVAVDADGRRSAPASLTVNTDGLLQDDEGPRMPRGLRAEIWSETAVGLTWERSPAFGTRYVVFRDGEIARDDTAFPLGAFGPSFSDFGLAPGIHDYLVIAVDRQGRRSPSARVVVNTRGGSGGDVDPVDILRTDNAVEVIATTFDAFRGRHWADTVAALPGFPRTPQPPFTEASPLELDCLDGGTLVFGFTGGPRSAGREFRFDDCREEGAVFDGSIRDEAADSRSVASDDGFSVTRAAGRLIEFSGRVVDERGDARRALRVTEPMFFGRFEVESPTTLLQVDLLFIDDLVFQYGVPPMAPVANVELSGTLEFVPRDVGSPELYVTTPEALRRPILFPPVAGNPDPFPDLDNPLFTEGRLRIEAIEDGSFIVLEADNGDAASARVSVDGAFGGRAGFDVPWSTWRENLLFDD